MMAASTRILPRAERRAVSVGTGVWRDLLRSRRALRERHVQVRHECRVYVGQFVRGRRSTRRRSVRLDLLRRERPLPSVIGDDDPVVIDFARRATE
jgi:hypothetical protein